MAHLHGTAIYGVTGSAIRWNGSEQFYENRGSDLFLDSNCGRHIIIVPSANLAVHLPNDAVDGWQVHVGFAYSEAITDYEIEIKVDGDVWFILSKGRWCECVRRNGGWYIYPVGTITSLNTLVIGDIPPLPPTVPVGAILQQFNISCVAIAGGRFGGFIRTPAQVNGVIRRVIANTQSSNPNQTGHKFYVMTATITGNSFTKKHSSVIANPYPTPVDTCATFHLATRLPVSVGDYIGFFQYATKRWNFTIAGKNGNEIFAFNGNPETATIGNIHSAAYKLLFNPIIEV
jgi:hypothetical protein